MTEVLRKSGIGVSIIAIGLVFAGGTAAEAEKGPGEGPVISDKVLSANTAFGLRLFRNLAERGPNQNIVMSPVGLGMVLAMAYDGAAGETAREMAEVLGLEGVERDDVNEAHASLMAMLPTPGDDLSLEMANSLWADEQIPLREDFLQSNRLSYGAAIGNLDLSDPGAAAIINAWIEEETGGKIATVIDNFDPEMVLYLINAMYFNGRWAMPFDSTYTEERDFTLADGSTRPVATMMAQAEEGHYYLGKGFKAARLDYSGGEVSMYLFLPDEATGLEEFYGHLHSDNWTHWLSGFETGPTLILLPRFSLEYDALLNDALKTLGMKRPFGHADFGRMTSEPVFISMVKQKVRLEVNEQGTEAASASLVGFKKGPALHLAFTRPFCFAVVDNTTAAILFIGTVAEP
jgi:serpin B